MKRTKAAALATLACATPVLVKADICSTICDIWGWLNGETCVQYGYTYTLITHTDPDTGEVTEREESTWECIQWENVAEHQCDEALCC